MSAELCSVASKNQLLEETVDVSPLPGLALSPAFYTIATSSCG